jgi:hypothetical protein
VTRARLAIPIAWGAAALLLVALAGRGTGISREEARVLAEAGAVPSASGAPAPRPPLPTLLARASHAVAAGAGLPHLAGYRLASALCAGLAAALLALLALELAGPLPAALAPALLLCAPRLLLPLAQAGPAAPAAALSLAVLLAYRRALVSVHRSARLCWALGAGALFGLALAVQLEAGVLFAGVAVHAAFLGLRGLRRAPAPAPAAPREDRPRPGALTVNGIELSGPVSLPPEVAAPVPLHPRCAFAALAAMAALGPAVALALWPALWADPLHRLLAALAAVPGETPVLYLGQLLASPHPPWGYPAVVSALALPAALMLAMAAGLLQALARLLRRASTGPERSTELLLLVAALGPLVAAQAGLAARAPGPGPWFPAFPLLALLAARALVEAAEAVAPSRARTAAACLAAIALAPGVLATARAYPALGASWGELAGGAPGAASLGLPRHDGEAAAALVAELSARARPGARVHFTSLPPAALAVYAADGRLRPDLVVAASLADADVVLLPVAGRPRQDEYRVWAALGTTSPVAGVYLDEVPLAWVYARPGAWR